MSKMMLKNVRLSFPSLFQKASFDGNEGKFESTLLIDKSDKKTKDVIDAAIAEAITEAKVKVPSDKRCLKDGDESDYDGYEGHWSFKAASSKRPTVIDRDKTPIIESDEKVYAGCYVNAVVDIWIQNNKFGKRVNANLYGIQFVKDGEPFGLGATNVTDSFDDLDDL
jgi:hypothetical protein